VDGILGVIDRLCLKMGQRTSGYTKVIKIDFDCSVLFCLYNIMQMVTKCTTGTTKGTSQIKQDF
jgi:hypothetical protein